MFHKKMKAFALLSVCSLLSFSNALPATEELALDVPSVSSELSKKKQPESLEKAYLPTYIKRERSGPFISTNTGIGILFSQSKFVVASSAYEAIVGYHVGNSIKVGAAYQYQHAPLDVKFQGEAHIAGKTHSYNYSMETGLSLQSAALKLYTSPSHPYRWLIFTFSPYVSIGTGLGWADVQGMFQAKRLIFMGDVGFAAGTTLISTTAGCKFNNWSWENRMYSIIPYVGLQLSF